MEFELITTEARLDEYLEHIKQVGMVAIDTETDGLDPISDRIAGFSVYTKGENPAYIPMNHDYYEHNVSVEVARRFMQGVKDSGVKIIMHTARFDIRVIKNAIGVKLHCDYDVFVLGKILNENEREHTLKYLWSTYCNNNDEYFKYQDLFSGVKFTVFDPTKVFIYAALDALMTYQLYEFQIQFLDKTNPLCVQQDLVTAADLMDTIEMPVVEVAVDMEEYGVCVDKVLADQLRDKYQHDMELLDAEIQREITKLMPIVRKNLSAQQLNKLSNPINLNSPEQLKTIFYRGLGMVIPPGKIKNKKEDTVNQEALEYFGEKYPEYSSVITPLLAYKLIAKVISTYLVAIPKMVNPKTGRLHTSWITIGADTGRFSSREPNLQNIPAKNKDIRPIFVPSEGYVFVGADYHAQEPCILTEVSQDPVLIENFRLDRDIYSTLIGIALGLPYEQCTKATKEGKERRNKGKVLQLALSYGMQVKSLALQLEISEDEAKVLFQDFKNNLATVFTYEASLKRFCKTYGYVKTLGGRKRRFPEYTKPAFEFVGNLPKDKQALLAQRLRRTKKAEKSALMEEISQKYNVKIIDNTFAQRMADTRIMNAVIQGSAAEMTKLALILIHHDKKMKEFGAHLVMVVHDEIIMECPKEHGQSVKIRLEHLMAQAGKTMIKSIPFRADGEVMERWYKD
jgi:DNA polymerase-1